MQIGANVLAFKELEHLVIKNCLAGLDHFHSEIMFRINVKCMIMAIFDIISIGVSSIIMVVLSKSRLHFKNDCCSCSYNENNIDLSKLQKEKENDDEGYDDLPMDSIKDVTTATSTCKIRRINEL